MINYDVVTIEDCVDMYDKRGITTVINDGKVVEFKGEADEQR